MTDTDLHLDTLLRVCAEFGKEIAAVTTQMDVFRGVGPALQRLYEEERRGLRRGVMVVSRVYKEAIGGEETWTCYECVRPSAKSELTLELVPQVVDRANGRTVDVVRGKCPHCQDITGWEPVS